MASKVFMTDIRSGPRNSIPSKVRHLFHAAGLGQLLSPGDFVALKLHWGEEGNLGYIAPPLIRPVAEECRAAGARPFITDTNTLYHGKRRNAVDNLETARRNGFTPEAAGAPVIVADGLMGLDYVKVAIEGRHFREAKIAAGIHQAQALMVLSHFTGHLLFGFGGVLKGVGMGCAAPSGKQELHSDVKPRVDREKCTGCAQCLAHCPVDAITLDDEGLAVIDEETCIGCGECVVVCPVAAIPVNWESSPQVVQEKTAEYALAAIRPKREKCGFLSYVVQITPDCDCCDWNDAPIVPDLAILASRDPVALDQAAFDLVNRATPVPGSALAEKLAQSGSPGGTRPAHAPKIDYFRVLKGIDGTPILAHAEALGLGSREYELVEVES